MLAKQNSNNEPLRYLFPKERKENRHPPLAQWRETPPPQQEQGIAFPRFAKSSIESCVRGEPTTRQEARSFVLTPKCESARLLWRTSKYSYFVLSWCIATPRRTSGHKNSPSNLISSLCHQCRQLFCSIVCISQPQSLTASDSTP